MSMAYFPLDLTPAAMPGASASAGALGLQLPAEDAGVGLTFHRGWLVSSPRARRVRWLAPWVQAVMANLWNLAVAFLRSPFTRSCLGLVACALLVCWLALHAESWLFVDWLAGMMPLVGGWLDSDAETDPRLRLEV